MGCHDEFDEPVLAAGEKRVEVVLEHRLEGLLCPPLGMLRRQRLDPVDGEEQLEVERLFGPQRRRRCRRWQCARLRDEVRARRVGDRGDEIEDRRLRCPLVPGGQWIAAATLSCRVAAGAERSTRRMARIVRVPHVSSLEKRRAREARR